MFRSTSISIILLALATCAASPSRGFGQEKVAYLSIWSDWMLIHPFWPTPKPTAESSEGELANPFDPFPDTSEVAELESILATWDRVFAEQPFNTRKFRQWDYDPAFDACDPDQVKEYREGVISRVSSQRWWIRETRAIQFVPVYEPVEWDHNLVLFPNFFGPRHKLSSEKPTQRALQPQELAWDEQALAFWGSNKSKPTILPFVAEKHDPPLVVTLAYCGDGQARELARRYWMRVVSRESADEQPRIELRPRTEMDRGWKVMMVLLAADQTPYAIDIVDSKDRRTVFEFTDRTNVWWPDERRFTEIARLRKGEADFKKARHEQPVD